MPTTTPKTRNIIQEIKNLLGRKKEKAGQSRYEIAKNAMRYRRSVWHTIRGLMFVTMGILSAGFGLEGFLIPNGLIDGGVTGISLLINRATGFPFPVLLWLGTISQHKPTRDRATPPHPTRRCRPIRDWRTPPL